MSLNNPIGGYFELETTDLGSIYHDLSVALNSGRNALELIIRHLNVDKIYIPFYACDVILQPIEKLGIDYRFYALDMEFFPKIDMLKKNEALIYVNYFGILYQRVEALSKRFNNFIVDNSQAFFEKHLSKTYSFYSPRKFFGVPDGGFAYLNKDPREILKTDISYERFSHLIKRIDQGPEEAYGEFKANETKLDNLPLMSMSKLTRRVLSSINYEKVRKIRNENFKYLHQHLKQDNQLTDIITSAEINGPMVYPYLHKHNADLRVVLIKHKIFVARYWPNVTEWIADKNSVEAYLFANLIPLPIDQRYSLRDMQSIIDVVIN